MENQRKVLALKTVPGKISIQFGFIPQIPKLPRSSTSFCAKFSLVTEAQLFFGISRLSEKIK